MPRITLNEIEKIYQLAKEVYFKQKNKNEALDEAEEFGMNRGSAHDLVMNFKYMYNGQKYSRTNNNDTTEYYLQHFLEDFGINILSNAVQALELHIDYYENLRKTTMHGLRKILKNYKSIIKDYENNIIYPDEINNQDNNSLFEGAKKQVIVNIYERDAKARKQCIEEYGYSCIICGFNFEKIYGEIGKNFIHVHHIKPLSEIKEEYKVNPVEDLRPVCPNCHAMLHKKSPAYSIEEIQTLLAEKTYNNTLEDE